MIRQSITYLLILLWIATVPAWADTSCPEMHRPFGAPASQVVEIVSGWFSDQGYTVRRDFPGPGYVYLTAWKSREEWHITIRPQSALASVFSVNHKNVANANQTCQSLREYVDGYLLGTTPRRPSQVQASARGVPSAVLDQIQTVVCIHTHSSGREVQFSGVLVDPEGLVLCTAHDLAGQQRVTVTFYD